MHIARNAIIFQCSCVRIRIQYSLYEKASADGKMTEWIFYFITLAYYVRNRRLNSVRWQTEPTLHYNVQSVFDVDKNTVWNFYTICHLLNFRPHINLMTVGPENISKNPIPLFFISARQFYRYRHSVCCSAIIDQFASTAMDTWLYNNTDISHRRTISLLLVYGYYDIQLCWNFRTICGGQEPSRNRVVVPARQCWNFRTISGGQESSRNRVVVPARQATQAGGIDSFLGSLKIKKMPSQATQAGDSCAS